jgi:hypothetical protein
MVNNQVFSLEHNMKPGAAEALPLSGYLAQPIPQNRIIRLMRLVAVNRWRNTRQQTGPSFAQPKILDGK